MGKLNWTVTYKGQAGWDELDDAEINNRVAVFQRHMRDTFERYQFKVISVLRETKRRPHTYSVMLKCGKDLAQHAFEEWEARISGGIVIDDLFGAEGRLFSNTKELRRYLEGAFRLVNQDFKEGSKGVEDDPIVIRRGKAIQKARMALIKAGFDESKLVAWARNHDVLCDDMIEYSEWAFAHV